MHFITFIAIQQSSQPNFISFPRLLFRKSMQTALSKRKWRIKINLVLLKLRATFCHLFAWIVSINTHGTMLCTQPLDIPSRVLTFSDKGCNNAGCEAQWVSTLLQKDWGLFLLGGWDTLGTRARSTTKISFQWRSDNSVKNGKWEFLWHGFDPWLDTVG